MNNMNYSIFRFTLNMHSHRSQASIPVKKFDTAVRFYITITDGGLPYTIEDGCMAVFRGKKADGSVLVNYCRIENGIVVYDFTEQTTSCTGIINCQIDLIGIGGKKIASPTFVIVVDDNVVYDKDIITSQSERNVLAGLVASAENARYSADVASSHSTNAFNYSMEAKASAENASASATEASQSAGNASTSEAEAESCMISAEGYAEDARNSANEAIDACNAAMGYAEALKVDRVTDISVQHTEDTHEIYISLFGVKSDGSEGVIGSQKIIDLPLESVVVNGAYDKVTEEVVLTLQNRKEIRFTVPTLVDGLVSQADFDEFKDAVDDNASYLENELGTKSSVKVNGNIVSEFDADTKVDKTTLAGKGTAENAGLVYAPSGGWNGINASNGVLTLAPATNSQIDGKTNQYNAIVPKNLDYAVRSVVGEDLSDHEKRIENLESALLTYTEDTTKVYEKIVPQGVGTLAVLNSIGGASYASKNLYNPNGSEYLVNADGSIHISGVFEHLTPAEAYLPSLTLGAGTYYISYTADFYTDALYITSRADGSLIYSGSGNSTRAITLDSATTLEFELEFDGTRFENGVDGNISVMVSKENIPFEPFFPGLRDTKVTEIVSKDTSDNTIDTYTIPADIQLLNNYGKEYTYVDFDNKQFVDNSDTIVLTGEEAVIAYWQYVGTNGIRIGRIAKPSKDTYTQYVCTDSVRNGVINVGNMWIGRTDDLSLEWQGILDVLGLTNTWVDKSNPTPEEKIAAVEAFVTWLKQRNKSGNPVTVTYCVREGNTTPISQYLTDYKDAKVIKVKSKGVVVFENEYKQAPNSTISYVTKR